MGNQGRLLRGGVCSTERELKVYQKDEEARGYRQRHEQRHGGTKREGMHGELCDSTLLECKVRAGGSGRGGEQVHRGQLGWVWSI